jgi:hypothetical protein
MRLVCTILVKLADKRMITWLAENGVTSKPDQGSANYGLHDFILYIEISTKTHQTFLLLTHCEWVTY